MISMGQLMTTTDVENFPGFPEGVQGPDLMTLFRKQAEKFGTKIIAETVSKVDLKQRPFVVTSPSHKVLAQTLIIGTGATAKRMDIPGARDGEYWQKGVSACAVCDGALPMFRNKPVFVIGGGDSAMEEGSFLTKFASTVFIVHRRDTLRASKIMQQRALTNPKIQFLYNSVVESAEGNGETLTTLKIKNVLTNETKSHEAAGLFFAIGHQPNSIFLDGQVATDEQGYILTKPGTTETNVPGVFACGDVQDKKYRQAITAAGTGCMSALDAEHFLAAHPSDSSSKPSTDSSSTSSTTTTTSSSL